MPHLSRDISPQEPILTVEIVNTVPETNLDEGVDVKPVAKPAPKPEEEIDTAQNRRHRRLRHHHHLHRPRRRKQQTRTENCRCCACTVAGAETCCCTKAGKPKTKPKPIKAPPKKPVMKSPENKNAKNQQLALASKLQDLTDRQAPCAASRKKKKRKEERRNKLDSSSPMPRRKRMRAPSEKKPRPSLISWRDRRSIPRRARQASTAPRWQRFSTTISQSSGTADRRRQCRYSYYCLNCSYK